MIDWLRSWLGPDQAQALSGAALDWAGRAPATIPIATLWAFYGACLLLVWLVIELMYAMYFSPESSK